MSESEATGKKGPITALRENVVGLIKVLLVVMFIKGCVIDQYSIPSHSMEPTLHGDPRFLRGDRVLVNKWIFGPRIPFTTIRLWDWYAPERWDIVVFAPPPGASDHDILIKRVVALPGERVKLHYGDLYINGEMVPFPDDMPEDVQYLNTQDLMGMVIREESEMVRAYANGMLEANPKYGILDDEQYAVVPPDHYFCLGDNSLQSADGRIWGWVPRDNLFGRAFGIWWPIPHRRDFTGFSDTWWGTALLYGIPAGLVGWELWGWRRDRRRRKGLR